MWVGYWRQSHFYIFFPSSGVKVKGEKDLVQWVGFLWKCGGRHGIKELQGRIYVLILHSQQLCSGQNSRF